MSKRVRILGGCVLAVASAFAAGPLNVKTGQWEMTYISKVDGSVISKDELEKMPAAQRAKREQAMAARAVAQSQPHVSKTCMTKEDLETGAFEPPDANCKVTVISRTSTHQEMSVECTRDGRIQKGHMSIEAPATDRIKGKMELLVGDGKVLAEFDGKWLGVACATPAGK
jgi:Protein of unknown function (DUF3617)